MLAFLGIPTPSSIVSDAISAVEKAIATGVQKLLAALFSFMATTTGPVFTSGWWTGAGHAIWLDVLTISGAIMVIALMLAGFEAIWSGSTTPVVKALSSVPVAVVKTVALVGVVSMLVSLSDQIANYLDGGLLGKLGNVPLAIGTAIVASGAVGVIFAVIIVLAVLCLWAELAVRAAVLYLVVMTAPMVIAAAVHPRMKHSWTKLAELAAGVIFAKVFVALAFAVAFAQIGSFATTPSFTQAIGALVAGITTLAISCFAPFLLFSLFSIEVAALEGMARRPVRSARDGAQMQQFAKGLHSETGNGFMDRFGSSGGGATGHNPTGGPGGGRGGGSGAPGSGAVAGAAGGVGTGGALLAANGAGAVARKAKEVVTGATRGATSPDQGGGPQHGVQPQRSSSGLAHGPKRSESQRDGERGGAPNPRSSPRGRTRETDSEESASKPATGAKSAQARSGDGAGSGSAIRTRTSTAPERVQQSDVQQSDAAPRPSSTGAALRPSSAEETVRSAPAAGVTAPTTGGAPDASAPPGPPRHRPTEPLHANRGDGDGAMGTHAVPQRLPLQQETNHEGDTP